MRIFMFAVMVLFGVLAIGAVIAAIIMVLNGNIIGLVVGLIAAAVFAIMANSINKSYRDA